VRISSSGRRFLLPLLGVAAAVIVDMTFAWYFEEVEFTQRQKIALVLAVVGFWLAVWLAEASPKDAVVPSRGRLPASWRVPLVTVLAALELFAVTKPAFGFSNRFGWRMFTEVLTMRVDVDVQRGDAEWEAADVPWPPWTTTGPRYHWDSLGEERILLQAYAEQLLAVDPELRAVRVTADYQRDGVSDRLVIERRR